MRRRWFPLARWLPVARWYPAAACCAAVLAVAACSAPGGTDGRLTDDWAALGEPRLAVPAAGTCYTSSSSNAYRLDAGALDASAECSADHAVEIAHVGEVTGQDAGGSAAPEPDSAGGKAAYSDCVEKVKEFLGDHWQSARAHLIVQFPSTPQWAAGARYYHCDLVEIADEAGKVVTRAGSLRDGLRGTRPAALACVNDFGSNEDTVDGVDFVACGARHTAEFAGVFTVTPAGRSFPGKEELSKLILDGCEGLAGEYLGVSTDDIPEGLGWFSLGSSEDGWAQGNQSVRCYVGVFDRDRPIRAGATLRGLGGKPIPR